MKRTVDPVIVCWIIRANDVTSRLQIIEICATPDLRVPENENVF